MGFLKIIKTLLGLEKQVKSLVETTKIVETKEEKPKKVRKPKAKKAAK